MTNTLHLNVDGADQGPTTDGAFFDWFNYVLTAGATPTETRMLIPRLRRLLIDNHGPGAFLVEANTQSERFTFFLDGHDRLPIYSAVPFINLNFVNLVLEPRGFMSAGAVAQGGNGWAQFSAPPEMGAVSPFIAVTGGQTYFTITAPPRVRPQFSQSYLADGLNGTQLAYVNPDGSLSVHDNGPRATVNADGSLSVRGPALYNPATGAYEARRTPTIIKAFGGISTPSSGQVTVYTPTAGKRWRLLAFNFAASVAGSPAAGFNLVDNAGSGGQIVANLAPPASQQVYETLPGNGWLSAAANNVLAASGPAAQIAGTLYLCEE